MISGKWRDKGDVMRNEQTNRTILVTGAAGFIGYHASRLFAARGWRVVGLDNFSSYYSPALKMERESQLRRFPNYSGHRLDVCDTGSVKGLVLRERPNVVLHLAAQPGVRYSVANPFLSQKVNVEGFLSVLEACRYLKRLPRVIFASSSSVYGSSKDLPFSEDAVTDTPLSLYAGTKKANELMAHAYARLYGMQTIGVRLFTVYGEWGRPDMALGLFADSMIHDRPIRVYGEGNMSRDFTYVEDAAKAMVRIAETECLPSYGIYNVGSGKSERLLDVIDILSRSLGVEPKMELLPMQLGDVRRTHANIRKLHDAVGYTPRVTIHEGIPRFAKWFKGHTK